MEEAAERKPGYRGGMIEMSVYPNRYEMDKDLIKDGKQMWEKRDSDEAIQFIKSHGGSNEEKKIFKDTMDILQIPQTVQEKIKSNFFWCGIIAADELVQTLLLKKCQPGTKFGKFRKSI